MIILHPQPFVSLGFFYKNISVVFRHLHYVTDTEEAFQ